jgi:transcription elongation GreA/GreB family factor
MNRIEVFYESNHLMVFIFFMIVTILIIYNKNTKIKELISQVGEIKIKISEFESIKIEKISKAIKLGSLVRLKYVLTGEIINILITENESNKFKNDSNIFKINIKTPLAIALIGMEEGNTIKFKKSQLDEIEVYVLILDVNNGFNSNTELVII